MQNTVQSLHGTVKQFCAFTIEDQSRSLSDHRLMRNKLPIRPFLRAWREHFDWSQDTIANKVGTIHSTVSRWERGVSGVDDETFLRIADAYGITVAELSAHPDDAEQAKALGEVLEKLRGMSAAQLRGLAGFLSEKGIAQD